MNAGTVKEGIAYAKAKYPNLVDQTKWVKALMSIIERDHGEDVHAFKATYNEYNCVLKMWADAGEVYLYYELYKGVAFEALGLECSIDMDSFQSSKRTEKLFSSSPKFNQPIVAAIFAQNE